MNLSKSADKRLFSTIGFSLLFAYLLSFLFEGQVFYSLRDYYQINNSFYVLLAITMHLMGLFSYGFLVKSPKKAKNIMLSGMAISFVITIPFFFSPSFLWTLGLIIGGYVSGCAVASWGYFLKAFTPKNQRIRTCADVLILSNIIMIAVNIVAINLSPHWGLLFASLCLLAGMIFIFNLPINMEESWADDKKNKTKGNIKKSLLLLYLFIFVITINSGLMYQVINPAFTHLTGLVSWYWALPYITALIIVRNLPTDYKRSNLLYFGMAMIIGAFIGFMLLGRNTADYIVVDTLMLGACGIFDLFWWSIIGEMLDYTENPIKIFGIGLSANVLGVLTGDVLGISITSMALSPAEIAVIALTVVCITLVMLPPLNQRLIVLLKNHAYLTAYDHLSEIEREDVLHSTKTLEELTLREKEVLQQILSGKSNREIAAALFVSENTIKTHARNIFSKYDVNSRAELISTLLKNQSTRDH